MWGWDDADPLGVSGGRRTTVGRRDLLRSRAYREAGTRMSPAHLLLHSSSAGTETPWVAARAGTSIALVESSSTRLSHARMGPRLWALRGRLGQRAGREVAYPEAERMTHGSGVSAAERTEARLRFVAQENILHEHMAVLTRELAELRQREAGADAWDSAAHELERVCDAVVQLRTCIRNARAADELD